MEKQARLDTASPAWRFVVTRLRALAPTLETRIIPALRLGRRLFTLSQPWTWRFALLPILATVSVLIARGNSISWGLVASEALAVICALSGWAVLRAYKPTPQSDIPYLGVGVSFFVVATLAGLSLFATASAPTMTLGALALALIAFDLAPASLRDRAPRAALTIARHVVAPALLGVGLVLVTALAQRARPDMTLWALGVTLSLLTYSAIQARALAPDSAIHHKQALWRSPLTFMTGALALAGALIVLVALPANAPHGLLLGIVALPGALVAVTGLWRSTYLPARALAARRVGAIYTLAALALTAGTLVGAAVSAAGVALIHALGG